ncbi:MAG: UvrB/UvrC motif-containing protein [Clostridia bacterium]|nr:UvrB/UvrC motif-containing protein [Clostridia bacterium]
MLCTECKKNNATVFYQQSINGQSVELALCQECAEKHGILTGDSLFGELFKIPQFSRSAQSTHKSCTLCGSNENNFIKDGKVSCPVCYEIFAEELSAPIKRIHGNVSHIGRAPAKLKKQSDKKRELEELKRKLNEAVEKEEYENAAVIRDRIRDIEASEGGM